MQLQLNCPSYWHKANLAKLMQFTSSAVGASVGAVAANDLFEHEVGTPAQITALAIPSLIFTGRALRAAYEKFTGNSITQKNPIPLPYCFGICVGITAASIFHKDQPEDYCNDYKQCPEATAFFADECQRIIGICRDLLLPQDAWILQVNGTDDNYCPSFCNSTFTCGVESATKNYAIKNICSRILYPKRDPIGYQCSGWNHDSSLDRQITDLQQELYNLTSCDLSIGTGKPFLYNARAAGAIAILAGVVTFWTLPIIWDDKVKPLRIVTINEQEDPLINEVEPHKTTSNPLLMLLENS